MRVCKSFSRLLIPLFLNQTRIIYETKEHLKSLREHIIDNDYNNDDGRDGLFSECATWKVSLCRNDDDEDEQWSEVGNEDEEQWSDDEDVLEVNDCTFQRKLIPFGSPLCRETIKDQFWLVQDKIDLQSYKKLVEKELKLNEKEQGLYEINPFVFQEKIDREKGMIESYINDVQESIHVDCGNPIWLSYDDPIFTDDERFNICQIEYQHIAFHALRSGISRLSKQGGVLLYEPAIMEDMFYQLKKFIYLIIKDAYETKFPNKTEELQFEESLEQYSRYCIDPNDKSLPCFDDNLDTDKKLSENDIIASFKKMTGKSFLFGKENDPYDLNEYQVTKPEEQEQNIVAEDDSTSDYSSEDDSEEEQVNSDFEILQFPKPIDAENFIDDSNIFNFDLENLGDSLPELLMKVSIRVHEEVYGKERAHIEKLYLQNWYGNGDLFFMNCSKQLDNPQPIVEESQPEELESIDNSEIVDSSLYIAENKQIEIDKKEDLEYFGYSLYEDDFEELPILEDEDSDLELQQSTEEESLRYQLRRMLREQSYECIVNYFEKR
ncbi:hypothetical protein NAEGRDRAFT_80779 [Naegleria gruberi]|uniref:Uncharacterized protein n=1 Tax=Naegleria gruberi TaxID=5762 RepID=D2VPP9_NAEGR|nr:uncharacterized protein NAEGRDRAFT_80779 [Naegleria gruberi]EFC41166.1 hypothetical protein NAEGRDRAFT_80779 [Naegleria gruberi]|eukprot:XP_002673910.1 hypothetical protein NAEGRDRAFT_80779 [Naegleria gruberi strain NEG-M]